VIASALGACVRQLPPAPTPPAVVPQVQAGAPPATGHSRMIVDVVEGPAPVQRIQMAPKQIDNGKGRVSYAFNEEPQPLCPTSPCVADVPAGTNLLLGFPVMGKDAYEVELVHVGPDPSVYRRSLSVYTEGGSPVFGILATSFGGASLITGTALLPIGLSQDSRGMTLAGGITLGAGGALLTIGILSLRANASTFRPGSSTHFPLSAASP
jgi:hypothetical protein